MHRARPSGTCALVEVTWVLMQKGRKDAAADHHVGEALRIGSPEALAVTLGALLIVGSIRCLIDSCEDNVAGDTDWIGGSPEGELILQLLR